LHQTPADAIGKISRLRRRWPQIDSADWWTRRLPVRAKGAVGNIPTESVIVALKQRASSALKIDNVIPLMRKLAANWLEMPTHDSARFFCKKRSDSRID